MKRLLAWPAASRIAGRRRRGLGAGARPAARQRRRRTTTRSTSATTAGLAFVRLRYAAGFGGFGRRGGGREPPWAHDYPTADIHMMKIVNELTTVGPHVDGSNIYSLDDPGPDEPSDRLHVGAGVLVDDATTKSKGLRELPAQGRVHDLRRLPRPGLVEPRRADEAGAAGTALRAARRHATRSSTRSSRSRTWSSSSRTTDQRRPTGGSSRTTIRSKRLIAIANRDNDLGEYLGVLGHRASIRSTFRTKRTSSA